MKQVVACLLGLAFLAPRLSGASPSLAVGSASGQAGTTVTLPVSFDPGGTPVTDLQFVLTLPTPLSTGVVTAGPVVTGVSGSVGSNLIGDTWLFAADSTLATYPAPAFPAGTLLTVELTIAPGTPAGTLAIPISDTIYGDTNGVLIAPGISTGGSITVLPSSPCLNLQLAVQAAVAKGGRYGNQGALIRTATAAVTPALTTGEITEACAGCIINQFARRIPIAKQSPCPIARPADDQ